MHFVLGIDTVHQITREDFTLDYILNTSYTVFLENKLICAGHRSLCSVIRSGCVGNWAEGLVESPGVDLVYCVVGKIKSLR